LYIQQCQKYADIDKGIKNLHRKLLLDGIKLFVWLHMNQKKKSGFMILLRGILAFLSMTELEKEQASLSKADFIVQNRSNKSISFI